MARPATHTEIMAYLKGCGYTHIRQDGQGRYTCVNPNAKPTCTISVGHPGEFTYDKEGVHQTPSQLVF